MKTLPGVTCKHPLSAYTGLQKSLQQEWTLVQEVTPGIGDDFGPVEQVLREPLIWDLFLGIGEGTPGRWVTLLPVKQAGLALPDLTKTASENWTTSCVITGHLVTAIRGQEVLRTADHSACLQ